MRTICNKEFRRARDYGRAYVVEDYHLKKCEFHDCLFSTSRDVQTRSTARNIEVIDCSVSCTDIGPAILEDVYVNGLKVREILILWDPLFKHVVLEGEIGTFKINNTITSVDLDPKDQLQFDLAKEAYYKDLDWALDISNARFKTEFDMRGIPARLVRIDPDTQGYITRESVLQKGWRDKVRANEDLWRFMIDLFIEDGDPDLVLAASRGAPRKRFQEELAALNELKEVGVVLNCI